MITTSAPRNLSAGGLQFSIQRMCLFFASALCCVLSIPFFIFAFALASRHRMNDYMAAIEFSLWAIGLLVAGGILRFAGTGHVQIRAVGRFPAVCVLIRSLAFAFGILVSSGALTMLITAFLIHNRLHLHWFDSDWPQMDSIPAGASIVRAAYVSALFYNAIAFFLLWAALRGVRISRRCD